MNDTVKSIPIDEINILNPRVRNQVIAEEIRRNIRGVGLKRPITVTPALDNKEHKKYDLVCGQGRLEAFIEAGEKDIPAIVIEVSKEDAHIMSLTENIARRPNSALELVQSIKYLKTQGYEEAEIAAKTNLGQDYIHVIIKLLESGETRLVSAVEKGQLPLYLALDIAAEDDEMVQKALIEAHESGKLSGSKLMAVKRLINRRKYYGKAFASAATPKPNFSGDDMINYYERTVKRKKQLVARAEQVKHVLTVTTVALKQLLDDVRFCNQLKVVQLDEIPKQVADLLPGAGKI